MKLKHIGTGRHRAVFLLSSGRWVIKVPVDDMGYHDNWSEASQSKVNGWLKKEWKARCKLLRNGCLIMEYVEPVKSFSDLPDWTNGVDCWQVGYTLDGRLVAYDYA